MHMLVSLALSLSTASVCLCACVCCELAVAMTLKDSTRLYAFPAKRTQIQNTHTHCCTGVIVVWSLIAQPCGKLSCSSNWIYS